MLQEPSLGYMVKPCLKKTKKFMEGQLKRVIPWLGGGGAHI